MEKGKFYKLGELPPKKEGFIPHIKPKSETYIPDYARYKVDENFMFESPTYHKIKKMFNDKT